MVGHPYPVLFLLAVCTATSRRLAQAALHRVLWPARERPCVGDDLFVQADTQHVDFSFSSAPCASCSRTDRTIGCCRRLRRVDFRAHQDIVWLRHAETRFLPALRPVPQPSIIMDMGANSHLLRTESVPSA